MTCEAYTYQPTTALRKIRQALKQWRILAVQGGQGASKTISIVQLIIDTAERVDNREVTIFGSELTKMKATVIRDFLKVMKDYGFYRDENWNKTSSTYTFPNGSYIEFVGLDQDDIGKGMRRDIVYFNEANRGISFEAFQQIASRAKRVILDFNPDAEFWIHNMVNDGDAGLLIVDYSDNEFLPQTEVDAILGYKRKWEETGSKYWENKWRVYGLGQIGILEGQIFTEWGIIPELPKEARLMVRGLDFGYTNDPTALISIYYHDGGYILNEELYATGLSNSDIISLVADRSVLTIADSAEPKSIAELRKGGLNVIPCTKGTDSIRYGLDLMLSQKISVTAQSKNLLTERSNYSWKKDKLGKALNVPIEKFNHGIDAARYAFMHILGKLQRTGQRVL